MASSRSMAARWSRCLPCKPSTKEASQRETLWPDSAAFTRTQASKSSFMLMVTFFITRIS
jgi:hypothetical protein